MAHGWSRREALALGVSLGGWKLLGEELPPQSIQDRYYGRMLERWKTMGVKPDANQHYWMTITARYRTDPARIARALPPPLELDPEFPEVQLNFFMFLAPPETWTAFVPNWTYSESDLMLACKYQGHRCMTAVSLVLDQDFGRYAGRESQQLRKKDGRVLVDCNGKAARAWTTRHGQLLAAIETEVTDQPAHPRFLHREVGWGWMRHEFRLAADWRRGLIAEEHPVQFWRHFGYDEGEITGIPPEADMARMPRACDLAKTKLVLGTQNSLDPYGEFPVRELLGVTFFKGPGTRPGGASVPRGPEKKLVKLRADRERSLQQDVDRKAMEAFAYTAKAYDPPVSKGKVIAPAGWPENGSTLRLSPEVIAKAKARPSYDLDPVDVADLILTVDPAKHAASVPKPLTAGPAPELRILAVRCQRSDLTLNPFTELWLLTRCENGGKPAWFALSHVTGWEGDVLMGRETWGYPTKLGEPSVTVDVNQIDILGRRLHRDFFTAALPLALGEENGAPRELVVIGARRSGKDVTPRVRLIAQPWTIELVRTRRVVAEEAFFEFPDKPGPAKIGRPEPWFDFAGSRLASASFGRGRMRRMPAQVLAPLEDSLIRKLLDDRMDGWEGRNPVTATYLVNG